MPTVKHEITAIMAGQPLPLDILSATITLDETWAPYIQASMVCKIPSATVLAALNPRQANRVTIVISSDSGPYNTGTPVATSRTLNLGLRSRTIDRRAGTMDLSFASDEALLQDNKFIATGPSTSAATSARAIVSLQLSTSLPAPLTFAAGDDGVVAAGAIQNPGVSAWDYLLPLVQKAGLRLWCDETRTWQLRTAGTTAGSTPYILDARTNVTQVTDQISRDSVEWFDAVMLTYQWTDAGNVQRVAYDQATSVGWTKAIAITYLNPSPGVGAAAAMLTRATARGNPINATALSDYSMTPGRPIALAQVNASTLIGTIQSVSWSFPGDEMIIKSRAT